MISDFRGPWAQIFVHFGILLSDSFLERIFCRSAILLCHFWLTFGAKSCSRRVDWEAAKNGAKKGLAGVSKNFRKEGCVPYNNLWPGAVLGHGAWSLARGRRGPAGNWSRSALEARWRIPSIGWFDLLGLDLFIVEKLKNPKSRKQIVLASTPTYQM